MYFSILELYFHSFSTEFLTTGISKPNTRKQAAYSRKKQINCLLWNQDVLRTIYEALQPKELWGDHISQGKTQDGHQAMDRRVKQ